MQSNIANIIHRERSRKGLTQSDLAHALKTTQSAVARMEHGEQNLSTEMLAKLGRALGKPLVRLSEGALNIEINGGRKLHGSVATRTSKNGAVALLAASLLNDAPTTLLDVPKIEEVYRIIEVMRSIGVSVSWIGNKLHILPASRLSLSSIDRKSAGATRSILMFIPPLASRLKRFHLPSPGGCRLGERSVTAHLFALKEFGILIKEKIGYFEVTVKNRAPGEVVLYESGDTVTINAIMAAAKTLGKTTIKFASANYQVQELCFFLERLGVRIDGIGSTTLTIYGADKINKPISYPLSEDPIESMFFIASAIITQSAITIKRCPIDFLEIELLKLKKMGFKFKISEHYKGMNGRTELVDIKTFPSKLRALKEKIEARPYPGLNIDNLPFFTVIATQALGETLIHDWVFEGRAIYYKDLGLLGARTTLLDPHRLYVKGPTRLHPAEVICPPALRPGAVILIGMLGAKGKSILRNIYSINRGYEDIVKRLSRLGARIKILAE